MQNRLLIIGFLSIILPVLVSCKTPKGESQILDSSSSGPIAGVPIHYLGTHDIINSVVNFEAGGSVSSSTLMSDMSAIAGTGGMAIQTASSCAKAEKWAKGSTSFSASALCRVEYVGTGRLSPSENGVALHIIPLDANNRGFDTSYTPAVAPLTPGAVAKVGDGPVKTANNGLERQIVIDAIEELKTKFSSMPNGVLVQSGQDCLKNARAGAWTDIQAHYYCHLPYTIRYCYSTILAEKKNPVKAFNYCSDASNQSDWNANRDQMFNSVGPGGADWTWLLTNQGMIFKYIMFSQTGKTDFNIEAQNEVINATLGSSRPRRAVDTYPRWVKNQPRYDALRSIQQGQGAAPTPLPQPQPQPTPPVSSNTLTPGLYAEANDLEAVTCSVRLDRVKKNEDGNYLTLEMTGGDDCRMNGNLFSPGIAAKIICKTSGQSCKYQTTRASLQTFERPAKVHESFLQIKVFNETKTKEYLWIRIAD
jgi:hypothetical protein